MKQVRRKVCFLIPSVSAGGIETYLLRFVNHSKDEIDATVLVRNAKKGELYKSYAETGANIVFKPLKYFNIASILWYYRFFKKMEFDTICDFNSNFAGIPMFLGFAAGIRKRIAFYRQGSNHFKNSFGKIVYNQLMNRLVYRYSTSILANSVAGISFFFPAQYPKDTRLQVIYNGVDVRRFAQRRCAKSELRKKLNLPEKAFVIGHTGRFTEAKNQYFIVDVAKRLTQLDDDIRFVILGTGTDRLLPYVMQHDLEDRVTVLGYRENVADYLHAFDMFFFPSTTEGQPNSLIEAMVSGLPTIASNIPAIRECIPESHYGTLIDPFDVESAACKILNVKNSDADLSLQIYAMEKFDANTQFAKFFQQL